MMSNDYTYLMYSAYDTNFGCQLSYAFHDSIGTRTVETRCRLQNMNMVPHIDT